MWKRAWICLLSIIQCQTFSVLFSLLNVTQIQRKALDVTWFLLNSELLCWQLVLSTKALYTGYIPFKLTINYTRIKVIIWPVTSKRQSTASIKDYGAEIQIWLGNNLLEFDSLWRIPIDCFPGKLSVGRSKDNIT